MLSTALPTELNFDAEIEVPPSLRKYLTVTENARDIYRFVRQSHETRLRLLTRRFFNQIQHGCTNLYCNVPTCLSYRKRVANGPIRPHNDVTARALAIKCVEQYASRGRDLDRSPRREHARTKSVKADDRLGSGVDGLCQNIPVVPWYTDASEYLAKKSSAAQGNQKLARVASTTLSVKAEEEGEEEQDSDVQQIQTQHAQAALPLDSNGSREGKNASNTHSTLKRIDPASLTQSLFSRPEFDILNPTQKDTSPISPKPSEKSATEAEDDPTHIGQLSRRTHTFRILPTSAVMWLKSIVLDNNPAFDSHHKPDLDSTRIQTFINQSLYYVFSHPDRLIDSASTWDEHSHNASFGSYIQDIERLPEKHSPLTSVNPITRLPKWTSVLSMCDWIYRLSPNAQDVVMQSLLQSLKHAYNPAPSTRVPLTIPPRTGPYLPNDHVAHLLALAINITSVGIDKIFDPDPERKLYSMPGMRMDSVRSVHNAGPAPMSTIFWPFENEAARVFVNIADIISHRIALDTATSAKRPTNNLSISTGIVRSIATFLEHPPASEDIRFTRLNCSVRLLEFMQAVLFTRWNREAIVRRTGPVGGALEMLKGLYQFRHVFEMKEAWFELAFVADALDDIEMPYDWLSFTPDATYMHILQFSFLFSPLSLVRYFRSLNLKIMKLSHENAMGTYHNGKAQMMLAPWRVNNLHEILEKTRPHMAKYFVMTIRREHLFEDAIGQIWRRERQELVRPLKVRMGVDEGELGLDHGGVQQEFFRLLFAEAFEPQFGMFDTDPTTFMTWFKPGSLEPLYKYEALGILMSLAIYNGVTIPITMPLAFYRKILGLKVKKIGHIEDGWPELARSFRQLQEWEDGDVGDVMCRTYEFSYEAFGARVDIDMTQKSSTSLSQSSPISAKRSSIVNDGNSSDEAPLVTNANRHVFVKDYITYMTSITISSQFNSFIRGLHTLLSPQSLSIFPPATLKLLFEGHPTSQPLDLTAWQRVTQYEDYTSQDNIIQWFWDVLRNDFTQTQLRQLLEFVTASDRIPVGGWNNITFIVQRNAAGNEWLPGSSTCYGRLFLPEYGSRQVLKEKLMIAVETSLGFGMV